MRTNPRRGRLGLAAVVVVVGIGVAACVPQPPPPPPPAPAQLSITGTVPTVSDFFDDPGTTLSSEFTVTNTGGLSSGLLTLTLDNQTGSGTWAIDVGTCGSGSGQPALAAGASCTVGVSYLSASPTDAGSIRISVSASPGGSVSRTIQGATTTNTHLAFGVSTLNIDDSNAPGATSQTVTLSNVPAVATSTVNLSIVGASGTGTFSMNPGTCTLGIGAGGSCTVTVFYQNDTASGSGAATLQADGSDNTVTVALTGSGTGTPNVLTAPPTATVDDPVAIGFSSVTVTITNTGAVPTGTLTSILNNGTGTGSINKGNDTCDGAQIGAGATCTVELNYAGSSVGDVKEVDLQVSGFPGGFVSVHVTATTIA